MEKAGDFVSELYNRIKTRRQELGLTVEELANRMGYKDKSSISKIENGKADIPQSKVEAFAKALETTTAYLIGIDEEKERAVKVPPGFEPLPEMVQVPLIGNIACGTPITAEENIKQYIGIPAAWRADFALECHGDSMAPRICDGDIVCIRKQCEVETGQIAAVRIGEEATLKHFYKSGEMVQLIAENSAVCPPMIFSGTQLADIKIEGLAVGFCRGLL
ncbi:LexA family transcriptional regulator [Faecalibacterium sp. An122]|uniref:LexA family protein n=1 Tax=Faecalibacterium sp. An122 TaxID=1965551 RepID=UPI0023B9B73F|nr:LexA family transcriptional regulator [Faecalibacterium sp. An122]